MLPSSLKSRLLNYLLSILLFLLILASPSVYAKTVVIPIDGEIAPSTLTYLERAITDATNLNASIIVFKINTFGGRVDTTYSIVELISSLDLTTISFVEEKAISAGTLIAMSSQKIYMRNGSTLGDVAPIMNSQEGPKVLGEKFQSPLRAKFRSLAQKNGYPVKLSEAFVSQEIEIISVTWDDGRIEILNGTEYNDLLPDRIEKIKKKETVVRDGELLTLSDIEAYDLKFSSGTLETIEAIPEIQNTEIIYLEVSQSEELVAILNKYAFLIILIGIAGIYMEIKTPGFGVYGITAIIAFSIFFLSHFIVELATYYELIILILSLILITVEIFVFPGFGLFGLFGVGGLLISLILMMQSFTIPIEDYQWDLFAENLSTVIFSFFSSTVLFLLSLLLFPKIFKSSPLVFAAKLANSHTDSNTNSALDSAENTHFDKIGKVAVTHNDLRPSGRIIFDGLYFDAISDGELIKANEEVIITDYKLGSYWVKKKKSIKINKN